MKKIIFILGPAGSGKSTQAKLLAKKLGFTEITESNLLKEEAKKRTKVGDLIQKKMSKGELVPAEITCDLLFNKIDRIKSNKIIVDGFPREMEQANIMDYYLSKNKHKLIAVIYIDVPKHACIKRLLLRKRIDDTRETIKERLDIYLKETTKVIEKYRLEKKLIKIDGYMLLEIVNKNILAKIKDKI